MVDYHEGTLREKKARKIHTCAECKQPIDKGEIYIRNSVRINGSYTSHARHKDCVDAARSLRGVLATSEGFPLFMLPGFQKRPEHWRTHRVVIKRIYPDVYGRLVKSGLGE